MLNTLENPSLFKIYIFPLWESSRRDGVAMEAAALGRLVLVTQPSAGYPVFHIPPQSELRTPRFLGPCCPSFSLGMEGA